MVASCRKRGTPLTPTIQTLDGFQSGGSTGTAVLPNPRISIFATCIRRHFPQFPTDRLRQWSLPPQISLLHQVLFPSRLRQPILGRFPPRPRSGNNPLQLRTGISNDIFDALLKEYTINQDNLKTCHSSIDSSSKSVVSSLRQSIKLLSVQKRLHQKLLEFEIARLTPYWRSRADHIYKKLISRLPEDYQDTSSFDCSRNQNTLDRLRKLSNIEHSNTELQQKITKAIDDFLDCFDSQDSLFQRYITQRTDCVTYLDSTGYFPSLFFFLPATNTDVERIFFLVNQQLKHTLVFIGSDYNRNEN
jgi:hypothetical protein